ncbi:hypothetical protein [Saccharothrix sp. ST-888]|uniref:hypothetical protein n=1 Tax=Saccharothrix sp. ST-888 TaxID=1427391 RepID=UPI0006991B7E|nr:hypothetical protein [Saccharothrix sp. ST-888]
MAHAGGLIPPGLRALPQQPALPDLGETEFVLTSGRRAARGPVRSLADALLAGGDRLKHVPRAGSARKP